MKVLKFGQFLLVAAYGLAGAGALFGASLTQVTGTGFSLNPATLFPFPAWSGGTVLTADSYGTASPTLTARDSGGNVVALRTIYIPGARATGLRCMARGIDGTTVAGGWTTDTDGRTAGILVLISPDGATVNISRTTPFAVWSVAVAADGTVWAQGFIGRNPDQVPDADPSHGVIRHFDRSGKMIGSFLPVGQLDDKRRAQSGYLAVSGTGVGWVCGGPPTGVQPAEYFEIAGDGSVHQYSLPALRALGALAYTPSGDPVVGVVFDGKPPQSAILTLSRNTGAWTALDVSGIPSFSSTYMLGGSGGTLAFWDGAGKVVRFFGAN